MASRATVTTRAVRALAQAGAAALSDRDLLARFAADGDQAAFAALVARHAAMVRGVCRRSLPPSIDLDDACQAVFLLLARKAGGTRWQPSVANWLYMAARKVAHNARVAAGRRTRRESRAAVPEAVAPADAVAARELLAALDEELERLPPRYREPLVLCCLEGLTQDEAADRLGVSVATLKSQLHRGRKRLAGALIARGYELGALLLAAAAVHAADAAPPRLVDSILAAAVGSPSDAAAALARGVAMNGMFARTTVLLLAATGLATMLGLGFAQAPDAAPPEKAQPRPSAERADFAIVSRIGATRFHAAGPIGDARYSADGKRIVGHAGGMLQVWDAADGTLLRTIDTGLGQLEDPARHDKPWLGFAVHPRETLVACGGAKGGRTSLQIWDFETGRAVAEAASPCEALKAVAWTPDGKRLLERANNGWEKPTAWKLIVRDGRLGVLRSHDLPHDFGEWCTVMLPLPGSKQAILWQSRRDPTVFDLESGEVVRTLNYQAGIPSDLGISPDGKTLVATGTSELSLLDYPVAEKRKDLPVLRSGWEKPRPLFAPDGGTVYLWDHRPVAYDVATGKEKWKATFRTVHTVRVALCDLSPDGATLLTRHGRALCPIDARTGTERDPEQAPSTPAGVIWSPDGKTLFTRAVDHDRTWTAWEAGTGKRLFDLLPAGFVEGDDWKMLPDLFFLAGGREIAACVERSESTERVGPKEFLVFDAATGRCKRRLGEPLPEKVFRWMHPINVEADGSAVLMQAFAISAAPGPPGAPVVIDRSKEFTYKTVRWDPVKQATLREWDVMGGRTEGPRHYAPFDVTIGALDPDPRPNAPKSDPAKVRCYSRTDGRLVHELRSEWACLDPDRVAGDLLLTTGHDSKWVHRGNRSRYTPQPPFAYDLWELPSRGKLRVFELDRRDTVALGPGGRFVVHVLGDHAFEVYEPFALKKAVVKVATPCRAEQFGFAPDGGRAAVTLADASVAVWDTTAWQRQVDEQIARAVPANLAPLWDDLAGEVGTGLRAARLLSVAGDRAVALLGEKVTARLAPAEGAIKQLVADLDSPRFAAREKAEKELRALSGQAEACLRDELRSNVSPEARRRIGKLLQEVEARNLPPGDIRELRAVRALRWMGGDPARALLAKWAQGNPSAALTQAAAEAVGR